MIFMNQLERKLEPIEDYVNRLRNMIIWLASHADGITYCDEADDHTINDRIAAAAREVEGL